MYAVRRRPWRAFPVALLLAPGLMVVGLACGSSVPLFPLEGGSGGTGSGTPCAADEDCPVPDSECALAVCQDGTCATAPLRAGRPASTQAIGDCKRLECNGNGGVEPINDDTDVNVDGKECTADVCQDGTRSNPPLAAGTACGPDGTLACDGQGQCIGCTDPSDCDQGNPCVVATCDAGVCHATPVDQGTALPDQTAGDCKVDQCDGQGAIETANDDADVPVDALSCTDDVCTDGNPSHPPFAAGSACSEGSGALCDGNGTCVECLTIDDCGTSTQCRQVSCDGGTCHVTDTAAGTVAATQVVGNCATEVCDGAGALTGDPDDFDVPVDDGTVCTIEGCDDGVVQIALADAGTACSDDGGTQCDGGGVCAECLDTADCTDLVCDAQSHHCVALSCDDGNENGDEEGVDCGGSCPTPCPPTP